MFLTFFLGQLLASVIVFVIAYYGAKYYYKHLKRKDD